MQKYFFIFFEKDAKKTAENLIPAATGFSRSVSYFVRNAKVIFFANSL